MGILRLRPLFQSLFSEIETLLILDKGGAWTMPEPRLPVISLQLRLALVIFWPPISMPETNSPRLSKAVLIPPEMVLAEIFIFEEGPAILSWEATQG